VIPIAVVVKGAPDESKSVITLSSLLLAALRNS
jgi:hypothetical protein